MNLHLILQCIMAHNLISINLTKNTLLEIKIMDIMDMAYILRLILDMQKRMVLMCTNAM